MHEETDVRGEERGFRGLAGKAWGYAVGMLTEILTVGVLCAAAVLIILVVKAVA